MCKYYEETYLVCAHALAMVYEPCPLAVRMPAGGFSPCGQTHSLFRYQAELRLCASCSRRLAAQTARQDAQRAQRLRARRGSHPGRRAGAGTQGAVGQPVDLQVILGHLAESTGRASLRALIIYHDRRTTLDLDRLPTLRPDPSTTSVNVLLMSPWHRGTKSNGIDRSSRITTMLLRAVHYRIKRQHGLVVLLEAGKHIQGLASTSEVSSEGTHWSTFTLADHCDMPWRSLGSLHILDRLRGIMQVVTAVDFLGAGRMDALAKLSERR
ncbi:hypothetical protein LTR59_000822 [Friedmanniomyces endolithicus]|nr:hypothetical protein LTR94_003919 [Friedmanniomyces endolithicus]KAK0806675.1 hypothetical protein LTR38_005160 [Friedmanniomyces endolithicus]KAK0814285.1 hypothetical protein LTR59_000822 [Friedmanniomyces endolithicus]